MAPAPTPHQLLITFAPEYFGSILSWLLFGFLCTQFYTYTTGRPNDPIWLKLLVYFVVALVSAQLGLDTYSGFAALVSGWGNPVLLVSPPRPLILGPFIKSLVAMCVQDFYAWRIWAFLQRKVAASLFCGFMVVLSILQAVGGIGITAAFYSDDVQANIVDTLAFHYLWNICGLVNDILITATMVVILRDARSNLITKRTKTVLGNLIRVTVQTGAFTSLLALAVLLLFLNESKIGLFQTFPAYVLEPSYALSLLLNLNINIGGAKDNTFNSFYIPPSTLRFDAHARKPEQTLSAFELSLHSIQCQNGASDASHITIGKAEEISTDRDTSNANSNVISTTTQV